MPVDLDTPTWDSAWDAPDDPSIDEMLDPSVSDLIDALIVLQRRMSQLAALEADLLVRVAGAHRAERTVTILDRASDRERRLVLHDEVREELAAALHRSPSAMHDQLETARLLAGPLARTRDALAAGSITAAHARVIAEQARRLETTDARAGGADAQVQFETACQRLQQRVLAKASDLTPGQTRSLARRAVSVIDTDGAEQRRQQARLQQDVIVYPEDDGLAVLLARMSAVDAARLYAALETRAGRAHLVAPCDASRGERRVAALIELALGRSVAAGEGLPASAGCEVGVEVGVVVDLPTLLGLADNPGTVVVGRTGPEPITADAVRELIDDPSTPVTLRRLVRDPSTGALLDRGRRSYAISDALRAFLGARDANCRFPGCTRRAAACQIDHAVAWEDGGTTDRRNLGPLCVRHHQLKTHAGWQIEASSAAGGCVWVSPLGRRYVRGPTSLGVEPEPPPPSPRARGW